MKIIKVIASSILLTNLINCAVADSDDRFKQNEDSRSSKFSIALIGDLPYSQAQEPEFVNLMADLNQAKIDFVVHDGDFKGGSIPCTDDLYQLRLKQFNDSKHPFFYVFGDNEWTDCHRAAAGGFNPFERLNYLRSLFSPYDHFSLGKKRLPLDRQSPEFPENMRWNRGGVLFVGFHVPGSNNGLTTRADFKVAAELEYAQRNAANIQWLQDSFALAAEQHAAGVMLFVQANMWDFIPAANLTGYEDFIVALEAETKAFGKPVVLVNGDSHYFRIDKPLPSKLPSAVKDTDFPFVMPWESSAPRLQNFTRVETFGNPNSHWVKATIDSKYPSVFSFEEQVVEKNLVK
jgi:Calcineurin-like phosphoesterase